jgi:3-phosphoshikimate 1-carboxyvinyltransferase
MAFDVVPVASLHGVAETPGDKSISHRALMISALATGESTVHGLSRGHDVLGTASALRSLGIGFEDDTTVIVHGGADRMVAPSEHLDCGNSGTTIRLLLGLLAGRGIQATLVGDASLTGRPMDRVKVPLELMGASVQGQGQRCQPPVAVSRLGTLNGIDYTLPVASAQVKSAILFAGLFASGETIVREHSPTRIHTEEMFAEAGIAISTTTGDTIATTLQAGLPQARTWHIPGDPSQAAFFVVAGLLGADAAVTITNLYPGPGRSGFLDVLIRMGATIQRTISHRTMDVTASSSELVGTEILATEIPSLDEVPILSVAASAARGTTIFRDVGELRVKESDRYAQSAMLARSLGATVSEQGDDLIIEGLGSAQRFHHISLDPHGDHRMAMSAAIAGSVGSGASISDISCVETSFPGFFDQLGGLA